MKTPPPSLTRMNAHSEIELRDDSDDSDSSTLVGMPVVFDTFTEINGWEGHFMERIGPRALTKTMEQHRDQVKVLFNHGIDPSIGQKPLGVPDVMRVTREGLWTETPLDPTSYNEDLAVSIRSGAIDGMSFQFTVQRDTWDDEPGISDGNPNGLPERTIKELRLFEFGPVTFPAYAASTAGVRGQPAYEAWLSAAGNGTLTLADDHDAPPASGHPSVTKPDIARLARAVTRSLKDHSHGETFSPTR